MCSFSYQPLRIWHQAKLCVESKVEAQQKFLRVFPILKSATGADIFGLVVTFVYPRES